MKAELEEKLKGFRPQFGNPTHIRLIELVGKVRKRESLMVQKRKLTKSIDADLKEIGRAEQQIAYLLDS